MSEKREIIRLLAREYYSIPLGDKDEYEFNEILSALMVLWNIGVANMRKR